MVALFGLQRYFVLGFFGCYFFLVPNCLFLLMFWFWGVFSFVFFFFFFPPLGDEDLETKYRYTKARVETSVAEVVRPVV